MEQEGELLPSLIRENLQLGLDILCEKAKDDSIIAINQELQDHFVRRRKLSEGGGWFGRSNAELFKYFVTDNTRHLQFIESLAQPLLPSSLLHLHKVLYTSFGASLSELQNKYMSPVVKQFERSIQEITEAFDKYSSLPHAPGPLTLTNVCKHSEDIKQRVTKVIPSKNDQFKPQKLVDHVVERLFSLGDAMLKDPENFFTELYLCILQDMTKTYQAEVQTKVWQQFAKYERRWELQELARRFIETQLIDMKKFDEFLAQDLAQKSPPPKVTVEFVRTLVKRCVVDERKVQRAAFQKTLLILQEVVQKQKDQLTVRIPTTTTPLPEGTTGPRRDQALDVFHRLLQLCASKQSGKADSTSIIDEEAKLLQNMQQSNFLSPESNLERFLTLMVEISVEYFSTEMAKVPKPDYTEIKQSKMKTGGRPAASPPQPLVSTDSCPNIFRGPDAVYDLVLALIKGCTWKKPEPRTAAIHLLKKVLNVITRVLMKNHHFHENRANAKWEIGKTERAQTTFCQQPYFRLFSNLLGSLNVILPQATGTEETKDAVSKSFLQHFGEVLLLITPDKVPGFAFAWLDLISHRVAMPKFINYHPNLYLKLIKSVLQYLAPYLNAGEVSEPHRLLYKGLLKVLMVINHDFPQFHYAFHIPLCNVIPAKCFQMRNVILSSKPKGTRMPEPRAMYEAERINLKVPSVHADFSGKILQGKTGAMHLDSITDIIVEGNSSDEMFLEIANGLHDIGSDGTIEVDIPLISALVAQTAVLTYDSSSQGPNQDEIRAKRWENSYALYSGVCSKLPMEARYHFLCAAANHLRDLNHHTFHFSEILLGLFKEPDLGTQEMIMKVLIERVLEHTHLFLWGVLGTFLELMHNPEYDLWNKPYIISPPEIKRLFTTLESVMNQKKRAPVQQKAPQQPQPPAPPLQDS